MSLNFPECVVLLLFVKQHVPEVVSCDVSVVIRLLLICFYGCDSEWVVCRLHL